MIKNINQFNDRLALKITGAVSTMWMAYAFSLLALLSLPAILTSSGLVSKTLFPHWLVSIGLIALVAWIAQTFLQLVLLSVIMVGQKVQAEHTIKHVKKHIDKRHATLARKLKK